MVGKLKTLVDDAWDQTAYKLFFGGKFFGDKWDKLPPEFNWKPYWGNSSNIRILHFHGPKPHQKELLTSDALDVEFDTLLPLVNEKYFESIETWNKFYDETI